MAQNEMRAMRGMPLRVRSMEGLGAAERCRAMAVNEAARSWCSGFTSQSVPLGWCKTNAGSLPASLRDGQPAPSFRARPGVASGADCASWLFEPYVLRGDGARHDDRRQQPVFVSLSGVRARHILPTGGFEAGRARDGSSRATNR